MDTAKFKDVSIGVSCLGLLICAAFAVHVYHTTGLLGSKVSIEIAGTAIQIRKDTSILETQASKVLTETSTFLTAENAKSAEQLAMLHTQQKHLNELTTNAAWILADWKRDTAPRINAAVDETIRLARNSSDAVSVNSQKIQDVLATTTISIGAIGSAVDAVKTLAVDASGVIGAPGTTQGLAGAVDTLNAAGKNLTLVGANVASVIGQPGQPGTVGRIVSNVDQAIQDATHPEKLPFWKMVLERFLVPEIPAVVHDVFTRWIHPRQDVYILNSTAQSQPVTSTPAKKVQP